MSQEIDAIKSRLNIVDLIGEYVRLQKAGNSWKACCPFHNEKTPSFTVSEDKQFWHCFGCGKGGDVFTFLMEIEGLTFREALENLAQRTGVELPKYQSSGENYAPDKKNKLLEILELATLFYEKQLWEGMGKNKALNYLRERGLKDETIKEFRLGYAPEGWRNILNFLAGKGFNLKDILNSGLIIQKEPNIWEAGNFYDRFRGRIMFPILNPAGKAVGYSARVEPGGDESQAKYINTPETEIYHKGNILYGIDKAKMEAKNKDWILLVEGNMDVIAAHQAGIKNTVAVSGTALTSEQLSIIKRYTSNIRMFFDMDEAGQKAAVRSAQIAFDKELNVAIVAAENAKDAADMVKENQEEFLAAVNQAAPAMEYFIGSFLKNRNRNNIEDKKKIINELAGLVNSFANKMEREFWIKKIAEKLEVSENILFDEFNKREYVVVPRNEIGNIELGNASRSGSALDKIKNIQVQIMGALISDDNFWREGIEKYKNEIEKYFDNEGIVNILISQGGQAGFNFEKLLESLENPEQRKFLRELYFKNCEADEDFSSGQDKWLALEQYFSELKRQIAKKKSVEIIEKIKQAENSGDKEAVKKLSAELMEINNIR